MTQDPTFKLDPRLAETTFDWGLAAPGLNLRLVNDSRWPWLLLVPQQADVVELDDLSPSALAILTKQAAILAAALRTVTGAPKTNIASLGNVVNQFHLHIIARKPDDLAGAGPVWGHGAAVPYEAGAADVLHQALLGEISPVGETT
jgi:diadenosine tetraphosphate (Ap4A) HIT family hydrolase